MIQGRAERLRSIGTFPQLVGFLRDDLDWPIEDEDFEELTFHYSHAELGLDPSSAAKVESVHQLRPIIDTQPWGIFFVDFELKSCLLYTSPSPRDRS